jgi:formamidopyrimidine-DNA glycosylase
VPELPEVETVRRGLTGHTLGMTIAAVEVLLDRSIALPVNPDDFVAGLTGTTLLAWRRRGKYLIAELGRGAEQDAGRWIVHLRMTGQFLWLKQPQAACPHTRVRIWGAGGEELRFVDTRSFGQMWWIPAGKSAEDSVSGLKRLGPEPFSEEFDVPYLQRRMSGSRRPIKNALLDQALVAGIGNIYADESLFEAGIRPQKPSGRLRTSQLSELHHAVRSVLSQSIGAGGTTFRDFRDLRGTNGNYGGMAWVYRRGGEPCRRCGTTIRRDRLAGRSSHWCPTCQQ